MPGPVSSVRANVNHIRNLLEQYECEADGFTVWKELIQNANDADAAVLSIGWCRGLKTDSNSNPLLKEPALFVVNSGEFKPDDADKLLTIGDTSKSADTAKIGRFGLGMKSLFHWCEAFFFIASDSARDATWESRNNIFSPWFSPAGSKEQSRHKDWDVFKAGDKALIESELRDVISDLNSEESDLNSEEAEDHWFCVWIPLRNASQLSGRSPIPREVRFGLNLDDDLRRLFAPELPMRIGETLPLLDRLKRICLWSPVPGGKSIQKNCEIKCASKTRRPSLRDKASFANDGGLCSGSVFSSAAPTSLFRFVRSDSLLHQRELLDLQEQNGWPKVPSGPDESDQDLPEKAEPHAAVRVMETPLQERKRAQLDLQWAVFLPVGDKVEQPLELRTWKRNVSILLHGYFFTDAGRQLVKPNSNNHTIVDWNLKLQSEGTLPLLLPALVKFVQDVDASPQEICELVAALGQSKFIKERLPAICRDGEWLFAVKACEAAPGWRGAWKLQQKGSAFKTIPVFPKEMSPHDLLPRLLNSTPHQFITFEKYPRIATTKVTPWTPEELGAVVTTLVSDGRFASSEHLKYLADFLEHCAVSEDQQLAVGAALWPLLKKLFPDDSLSLETVQERAALIQRLVAFVPSKDRVCASWAESKQTGAKEVFAAIASMNLPVLVVPQICEPGDDRCTGKLQAGNCESILEWLGAWEQKPTIEPNEFAKFVAWVFQRVDPKSRNDVIGSTAAVIKATKYAGDKPVDCWLSPQAVIEQEGDRKEFKFCDNVFADAENGDALADLSAAFVSWPILNLVPELAHAVFHNETLPKYGIKEVVRVVNRCQALLGEPDKRLAVLERLKTRDRIEGYSEKAKAIRYLLHGNKSHRDDDMPAKLIQTKNGNDDDVWDKLAIWAMGKTDSRWRLLAQDISKRVGTLFPVDDQREALGIVPLDHVIVTDLLRGIADVSDFPSDIIDKYKSAYGKLLDKVSKSDDDLLRRLPIHRRQSDGMRVAITENKSYWSPDRKLDDELDFKLDDELEKEIELLSVEGGDGRRQRRESLTKTLSRQTAIEIALLRPDPSHHWPTILNALSRLNKDDIADELCSALRSGRDQARQPWVPTTFGPRWPAQIVNLPEVDVELCRLRETIEGTIVFHSDIEESVRTPPAFAKLSELELLPDRLQSLDLLKPWMAASSDCRTGIASKEAFAVWIELPWQADVMPAYAVLKAVRELCGEEKCYQHLAESLFGPIVDHDKRIQAIKFLSKEHARQQDQQTGEGLIELCFLPSVINAIQLGGWRETLSKIELLSAKGNWKSPSLLAAPNSNIADDDQVDKEVWQSLELLPRTLDAAESNDSPTVQETQTARLEDRIQQAAEVLTTYFREWDTIRASLIGGFLSQLGNEPSVRNLALNYLGRHSLEFVRGIVRREISAKTQFLPQSLRVVVEVERGPTHKVPSLLGNLFQASLGNAGKASSLVIRQNSSRHNGLQVETLHLRAVSPSNLNLRECLRETTAEFVAKAFSVKRSHVSKSVDDLFKFLDESDQFDVTLAQQRFEDHAEFLLGQLHLAKDPLVGPILKDWERLREMSYENKKGEAFGFKSREEKWNKLRNDTFGRLRNVFKQPNTKTQDSILAAVRRIIEGHNRYTPGSVPFEIFQNADDAAADRKKHFSDGMIPSFSLDVFEEDACLVFRHFGRCVNQVPPTDAGRNLQQVLADDLSGMLTLWLSTKGGVDEVAMDEPRHTGKFGLGFKSVFLISKRPKLLSGELACEIVGGVYPIPVHVPEQSGIFGSYLPKGKLRHLTTVLKLPLDVGPKAADVLAVFRRLAHIQVVFGREIHQISFYGQANPRTVTWEPKKLAQGCWHGELPSNSAAESQRKTWAILLQVFRDGESRDRIGELLFQHDGTRFCKLDDEVPPIWVTAPVQEEEKARLKLGFAINGDFELDPGRSNLAWGCDENRQLANQLGAGLAVRLGALFAKAESNWPEFCREIGAPHAKRFDFWLSLWDLLTKRVEQFPNNEGHTADQLIRQILWDKNSGMATQFYRDHAALPNGLPDGFHKLIKATDIKFAAVGVLLDAKVLKIVESWPSMRHDPLCDGSPNLCDVLVASDMVAMRLEKLAPTIIDKPADLTLAGLFEREKACLSSDRAELFASLLFAPPLTVRVDGKDEHPPEWPAIESVLGRFLFLDAANNPQLASNLLIPINSEKSADGDGSEEEMIAAFAPADRVLSSAYQGDSLRLFKLCRAPRKSVTASEVAYWATDAHGKRQKDAVIHYLSRGRLRESVIDILNSGGACWVTPILPRFKSADTQEREAKQALLGYERSEAIKADPASALRKVFEWWDRERSWRHQQFKGLSLTDSERVVFRRDYDPQNIEHRKAWLRVFILAMSHTKGWKQNWHKRAFLEFCERCRWLETFAETKSEPDDWLGILDGYFEQTWEDAQYYDWLGLFPGIYAIAQRLDSYVFAFQNIKKRTEEFSLREITRPQHPIPAPSINRVLGMGTNFIIREMLRSGVLERLAESPACAHAFVPTTRFQKTLTVMRCELPGDRDHQSAQAYRFFTRHLGREEATFGGDFDIPFQVLAGDEQLQNELLDTLIPQDDESDE